MATADTIAAIATAPGRGAIGLLRISGPAALEVAGRIAGSLPQPRQAGLRTFRDRSGEAIDRGLVLVFPAPRSYTGEHLVELQGHGGVVLLQLLLEAAIEAGARMARPGEFSERAFLNGRLDLAQAEAVGDLIDAASRQAVVAAQRSLEGAFSERVTTLADELMGLRAWVEGALDFTDEDVDWLADDGLRTRLANWSEALDALIAQVGQGRRLREGLVVAIVGQPNVGKSTLLNRLAGVDAAIVSDQPGTTRDSLREHLLLEGMPITIVDTAGLRETDDRIEQEGIRRSWSAIDKAELVLYLVDDRLDDHPLDLELLARLPSDRPRIVVRNKCDLANRGAQRVEAATPTIRLSAATGEGIGLLSAAIREFAGLGAADQQSSSFTARTRHVLALAETRRHLDVAMRSLAANSSAELIAEELRLAHAALGEITGQVTSEDLLGHIFASFCIGK